MLEDFGVIIHVAEVVDIFFVFLAEEIYIVRIKKM